MKYRRRKYVVRAGFQWRFVLNFIIVAIVGNLTATVLFNFFAIKKLEEFRWSVHLSEQATGEVLTSLFLYIIFFSLIFVSVLLVIIGAWMRKKMDGPIYRITEDLRQIKEGNAFIPISLRHKDEFRDVAVAINDMVYRIRERFSELRAGYNEVSQALDELKDAHAKGLPVEKIEDRIIVKIQMLQTSCLVEQP